MDDESGVNRKIEKREFEQHPQRGKLVVTRAERVFNCSMWRSKQSRWLTRGQRWIMREFDAFADSPAWREVHLDLGCEADQITKGDLSRGEHDQEHHYQALGCESHSCTDFAPTADC
jgi:hypothetical protein